MMSSDELMMEEIREAVEKIVRRHVLRWSALGLFPRPIIQYFNEKIEINLDAKATVHREKVIEADRRRQFLDIKFLTPLPS